MLTPKIIGFCCNLRAWLIGRSVWPRWTPSAFEAMAMSVLSFMILMMRFSLQIAENELERAKIRSSVRPFGRSWMQSAPP